MHSEIKAIRLKMGFSVREMASELKLKATTYQCYDEGSRKTPAHILASARISGAKVEEFMQGLPARVDERIKREFPNGIVSEV